MASTLPVFSDCCTDVSCGPGCVTTDIASVQALIQASIAAFANFQTQPTTAALKASTNHQQGWGALTDGDLVSGDGSGGIYDYQAASTAVEVLPVVIQPADVSGAGRWIKRI